MVKRYTYTSRKSMTGRVGQFPLAVCCLAIVATYWYALSPAVADAQAYWQLVTAVGDEDLWPEPPFTRFDVYIDSVLVADDMRDHDALPLAERVPGTVTVSVAPNNSTSVDDAFKSIPFQLNDGDSVAAVLIGYLDPAAHAANPNGQDASLRLLRVPRVKDQPDVVGAMEIRLIHATPAVEPFGLVDDLFARTDTAFATGPYGWIGEYTAVSTNMDPFAHYWAVGLESGNNYCQISVELAAGAFLAVTSGYAVNLIALVSTDGAVAYASGLCDVGIDDRRGSEIRQVVAYPNPSNSVVSIRFADRTIPGQARISLYDVLGRSVHSDSFNHLSSGSEIALDISHLANGVYFVLISWTDRLEEGQYVVPIHVAR